jgi:hypothetical protein
MAKRNAPCVIVDDLPFNAPAGHTMFARDAAGIAGLLFGCPCGCGSHFGGWTLFRKPSGWGFDGNTEKPTVTGSFGCGANQDSPVGPDGQYHWHGFLKAGVFEEC